MLFTLWWQRDLVLCAGKSPAKQRVEVFKRAGLNPALLDETMKLARAWPEQVAYSLAGGAENQSYIKALLSKIALTHEALQGRRLLRDPAQGQRRL